MATTGFKATFTSASGRDVTQEIYRLAQVTHPPGTLVCRVCLAMLIATALAAIDDHTPNTVIIKVEHLPGFNPTLN